MFAKCVVAVCLFLIIPGSSGIASEGLSVAISLGLMDSNALKISLPEKWTAATHKVLLDQESVSELDNMGVSVEFLLAAPKVAPPGEARVLVKSLPSSASFKDFKFPVSLVALDDPQKTVFVVTLLITVRPELTLGVWSQGEQIFWDGPQEIRLGVHPQGVLLRIQNQNRSVEEEPMRIHFQGHSSLKHAANFENLVSYGDEYSYWVPAGEPSKLEYREHYKESYSDIRTIDFNSNQASGEAETSPSQEL